MGEFRAGERAQSAVERSKRSFAVWVPNAPVVVTHSDENSMPHPGFGVGYALSAPLGAVLHRLSRFRNNMLVKVAFAPRVWHC